MIDQFATGLGGFIGKRLLGKLPGFTVGIPHNKIADFNFEDEPRRFFFLSAYGNMASHKCQKEIMQANVVDLWHVLKRIPPAIESFVYVSSSSVNLPVQTTYSRTKRAGEEMVQAMPIPGCIVRPFSVVGKGEQSTHLIPTLIRSCLEGTSTYFVPDATHDYVDVSDVVDGLIRLADERAVGVFEFGRGTAVTNREVLELVEKVTGKKANVQVVDELRAYDSQEWVCKDFTAWQYGWEPKKSLETSIREMVEDYKSTH